MSEADDDPAELVRRAVAHDPAAWAKLVDTYAGVIWAVTRSYRLAPAEAADVSQITWLRLVQNIDKLREPQRLGAWLSTTAKRECLNCVTRRPRESPTGEPADLPERDPVPAGPEHDYLRREKIEAVRKAVGKLPPRCRDLLQLLASDEALDYRSVSCRLHVPIGSIGPTRGRCLEKLRTILEEHGVEIETG
jgi:RNA polymerase sigma factor (sigma-70 family)